jgi:hypothetical protein
MNMASDQIELKKSLYLQALDDMLGDPRLAAAQINVSQSWIVEQCMTDPDFAAQCGQVSGRVIAWAVKMLKQHISSGSEKSLHFFLRYKGGFNDSLSDSDQKQPINQNLYAKLSQIRSETLKEISLLLEDKSVVIPAAGGEEGENFSSDEI